MFEIEKRQTTAKILLKDSKHSVEIVASETSERRSFEFVRLLWWSVCRVFTVVVRALW